jgi:NTP pyrophosphatase (non-canonical NTP hydrolase)
MTQQEQPGQEKSVLIQAPGIQAPTIPAPAIPAPAIQTPRTVARSTSGHELAEPQPHPELEQLIAVLEQLRAPGGCAWDAEQTHESLVRYLVEETYELIDAIESGNREELIEELGDVLYQVIFHSDIAAHTPGEEFTLEDVAAHMFTGHSPTNWQQAKRPTRQPT